MEEYDRNELLLITDDESSGSEDQDIDISSSIDTIRDDNLQDNCISTLQNCNYTKIEFITTKIALIFSSTALLILLPAYLDSVNIQSDAYNLIFLNSTFTIISLILVITVGKFMFNAYKNLNLTDCPIYYPKLFVLSLIYAISGILIIYAVDRKRVMCHLQDPIKGSILVFSLLYYFIFCRKLMGLQRIFAATTIIVGVFITVDYGLCDEFRCRGYERNRVTDDTGNWPWRIHSIWIAVYVFGLALFSSYFTLLERCLFTTEINDELSLNSTPSFLTTISRSIAFPSIDNGSIRTTRSNIEINRKLSAVHISLSIHIIGWFLIVLAFWTDTIPSIGKGSSISHLINMTTKGIMCHFQPQLFQSKELTQCGNTFLFGWLFLGVYVLFCVVSLKFLIMSQSAVYTVATITSSLPLIGIWWSLFKLFPLQNGGSVIVWSPSLSGELICSLLGLPIVLIGLLLFCKAHFRDLSGVISHYVTMPSHSA